MSNSEPPNQTVDDRSDFVWDQLTLPSRMAFYERGNQLAGLVHYTTFPALSGIISNNELWFSPVQTMNDYEEVVRGKRLLEEMSSEGGAIYEAMQRIVSFDQPLWERCNEEYKRSFSGDVFDTFVSCWSACDPKTQSHDNLTMWRGYSSEGNGAAVVVDPIQLGLAEDFSSEIIICPVFYETEAEFAKRAESRFTHYYEMLVSLDKVLLDQNAFHVANAFCELCFHLAVTHKHPGFRAENEWRFVWRRHRDHGEILTPHVRSQVTTRGMFEYLCLPLIKNDNLGPSDLDIKKLITEIMIGPTDDAYLKKQAVATLLKTKQFDPTHTAITISAIPYRSVR